MWWSRKNRQVAEARELERDRKVHESQQALLNAATSTADAAQDVTVKLKERLDDSLRQIEITSQLLSDALLVVYPNGAIESINPAAERIFGWKRSDLMGRDLSMLFRSDDGGAMNATEVMDKLFNCREGGLELEDYVECVRGKRRNGELFWIDINLSLVDRSDGSQIIILLCRDATKRIQIQKQLALNEQRYRSIFEQSLDGIFVVHNHHIVAANPAICRLLGYSQEEMIAQPHSKFYHEDSQKVIHKAHELRLAGDLSPKTYVVKAVSVEGTVYDILVSSTGMAWGDDGVASLILMKNISDFQ